MAGHSHWAGIKHKKAAADKKRGKVFSKHAKAIIVAARDGGGDPDANLALKYAIDRAKADNMPKDNIERAIKRGTGDLEGVQFVDLLYEGFAPEKVAIVVDILTDNRNRTASELRKLFEKKGGTLGSPGSVAWMFENRGLITLPGSAVEEEKLMELALEAGAEDVLHESDYFEVITTPEAFSEVRQAILDAGLIPEQAEVIRHPTNTVEIKDEKSAAKVLGFLEELEDHEDVQKISANFDIPDDIIAKMNQ